MKKEVYRRRIPDKKFGNWNTAKGSGDLDVREDTPRLANARLYQKIGDAAKNRKYEPRILTGRKGVEKT